ncbi:MAG: acyl-CoA dehydrogenase family protein [Oceanospirillaceae bacterium]|nr:acyl-CoA dehydrogenase family protein [Oceanospirillaceae bacterium]
MNFDLNEDQIAYVDLAQQFSINELAPHAAMWDAQAMFPKSTLKQAGQLGFCGLYSDPGIGGLALSRLDASLIFEKLAMGCTTTTAMLTIHNMAAWMVSENATSEAKAHYGENLTSGRWLASYCLTEANAGSDAASLTTKAVKTGNEYVISGSKIFISGAGETEVLIVMARTGEPGAKGISAFIVDSDTAGISFGRKEEKMGWNAQPTRMINFDQVRVPAANLLGNEGDGFTIAMKGLDGGRINIATVSVGTAQQALSEALAFVNGRKQFGKPVAAFQGIQFKLADMNTHLVAARQMVRLAAFKLDNKHPDATTYCAMAKRLATDVGYQVCDEALQCFGGSGYIKEYPMERYLRDSRVHRILEGTNEIMRVIIARRILLEDSQAIL